MMHIPPSKRLRGLRAQIQIPEMTQITVEIVTTSTTTAQATEARYGW